MTRILDFSEPRMDGAKGEGKPRIFFFEPDGNFGAGCFLKLPLLSRPQLPRLTLPVPGAMPVITLIKLR